MVKQSFLETKTTTKNQKFSIEWLWRAKLRCFVSIVLVFFFRSFISYTKLKHYARWEFMYLRKDGEVNFAKMRSQWATAAILFPSFFYIFCFVILLFFFCYFIIVVAIFFFTMKVMLLISLIHFSRTKFSLICVCVFRLYFFFSFLLFLSSSKWTNMITWSWKCVIGMWAYLIFFFDAVENRTNFYLKKKN